MSSPKDQNARPDIATPSNVITITRILLVPVFVAAFLAPWPEWLGLPIAFSDNWKAIIAAAIFVVISATDWLDGYLARSRNEVTDFGKFMDPLADKILVTAALICLVELGDLPTWVVLIILAREFIVSGVRMMAASKGTVIAASMVGKFKTVFQMIAIVLFAVKRSYMVGTLGEAFGDFLWTFSWIIMLIALALTIASMIDYLVKAREVIGLGSPSASSSNDDSMPDNSSLRKRAEELSCTVIESAKEKDLLIATAESLTGGMIGSLLTSVPGSSAVYKGGVVSYTNSVKHAFLDVKEQTLESFGAVSEQTALQMADGARLSIGADISISVTGLAGPDGDEFGNPVGTVWIGVSTADATRAYIHHFEGDRESIRLQTSIAALEAIIDTL
ncbi:MAG: CDP-diacylglycerol--glycerol-3-phosphate 3-phosphatidyltransferase [Eggerthellaceae bacterium]|nr:CDP-diacylglycerol--glycerol-3-phosphate 3-phosphatidyltransferase [Eggerthellaceae bacterium]